jgi:hypothetical protein
MVVPAPTNPPTTKRVQTQSRPKAVKQQSFSSRQLVDPCVPAQELGRGWFGVTCNVVLPIGAVGSLIRVIVLLYNSSSLPSDYLGTQVLMSVLNLAFCGALFVGLRQLKQWAWWLTMTAILLGPISMAVSKAQTENLKQGVVRDGQQLMNPDGVQSLPAGQSQVGTVVLLVVGLLGWTLPNGVYFYRRRSWFGISGDMLATDSQSSIGAQSANRAGVSPDVSASSRCNSMVSDREEAAFGNAKREFDNGRLREGLWAKVISEETDAGKQKQLYLRYRAVQILHDDRQAAQREKRSALRHWAGIVTKRVVLGVALFYGVAWSIIGMGMLFKGSMELSDDLLMLGTTASIVALMAFLFYIYLEVRRHRRRQQTIE